MVESDELLDTACQLILKGEDEKGLALLEIALDREPENPDLLCKAGQACIKLNRFNKALLFFNRASRVEPRHFQVLQGLGDSSNGLNQTDKAMEYYREALKADPGHIGPHIGVTYVLLKVRLFKEAREMLGRCMAIDPNFPSVTFLKEMLDRPEEALDIQMGKTFKLPRGGRAVKRQLKALLKDISA